MYKDKVEKILFLYVAEEYKNKKVASKLIECIKQDFMKEKVKLQQKNGFNTKEFDDNEIKSIIEKASNRLISMQQDNGRFIYGYKVNTGETINSYNILRHAGSVYSLIKYYEYNNDNNLKSIIEKSIDYLLNNYTKKYNKNTLLVY